jgi:nucleotide-binding universal stress UspA family protein
MLKLLVPVDGSDPSTRSIEHLLAKLPSLKQEGEFHLLNVQPPVPGGSHVASVLGHERLKQYHLDEGMAALKPAMQKLEAAGVQFKHHIVVGEAAAVIAEFAKEKACDEIVMGTHGSSATASFLLGSVALKVIQLSDVPVLLVK